MRGSVISRMHGIWVNLHDIIQLTKHDAVNTVNRRPLFCDHANVSCVPTELLFTPF